MTTRRELIPALVTFAALATLPGSSANAQAVVLPTSKEGVVLHRADLVRSIEPQGDGTAVGLAPKGAIRAGNDRIMVDVLRRAGTTAENPVVHDAVTEVYNIIEGSGQIELGGTIEDPEPMLTNGAPTNPANIGPSRRGTRLSGGTIHTFGPGDQIMIPPGTPHRFVKLDSPVVYSVVRVNPGHEKPSRPFARLVGPQTLNPGPYPTHWPYPDQYNSVFAAPEVHHLRYTDAKINFVEVAYFPGVHGQMHGHPWPSVFAIDAPTPKVVDERLDPERTPKVRRAAAPDGMAFPMCLTMSPETPHAQANPDTWPNHFYRLEFKRVDDTGIQTHWREWYPHMLDRPLTAKAAKASLTHDSILAAPNNYRLLVEDDHLRLVEVTLRPGETEPVHADPYPAVIAMDAISGVTPTDKFADPRSPLNGQGAQHAEPPPGFTSPSCTTSGPRAPHAMHNPGATPLHYYRIEFKRIDGPALKDQWRTWYPWMATLADETAKNPFRPNY